MSNSKIKLEFSIKKKEDLKNLSYEELLRYVENLTDNIVQEKPKKDSTNSGISPSSDMTRPPKKNQSMRKKSGKKSGGQKGHKGITLTQTDTPDKVLDIPYNIENCKECGSDLSEELEVLKEKRQVLDIDLKAIEKEITQYQSYSKICSICGYDNHDNSYPKLVAPNISYGKNIMALARVQCVIS